MMMPAVLRHLQVAGQDLRHALRGIAARPGVAVIGVLTLGLSIGALTTIFSVVDAMDIRGLPYANADRLVAVWSRYIPPSKYTFRGGVRFPDEFLALRDRAHSFERMEAFQLSVPDLVHDGEVESL